MASAERLESTGMAAVAGRTGARRPKVAIVMSAATQRGGAEMMLLHLIRHAADDVAYHVAFLENGPMVAEAQSAGWQARVFHAGHLRQAHHYATTVLGLARWFRREAFDGVLSWMPKAHLYAAPAAMLAGCSDRLAWFQHGKPAFPPTTRLERLTMALPAVEVWCPSRHTAEAQRRCTPSKRVRVVYPSVDLEALDPERLPSRDEARARLGLPQSADLVGMVARLERWKGCDTFVDAASEIHRIRPDARFVIVGGEHFSARGYPAELRRRADAHGLGDQFLLPGQRTDVPLWIQAMDVLVVASEEEPFGMVALEGMALGKPVIASASGGPLEVIDDGRNGHLFPLHDAHALALAVERTLTDAPLRSALGREGRLTCQRFSADRLAAEVSQALRAMWASGAYGAERPS